MGMEVLALLAAVFSQDWSQLRGGADHSGYVAGTLPEGKPRRSWVRHFANERLGSAMEPIVGEGRVYIATHNGSVYALDGETGEAAWRFTTTGAFLHSPAYSEGRVIAACTDGRLYAIGAKTGKLAWQTHVAWGGFASSPAVAGDIFIGTRAGDFLRVDAKAGKILWKMPLGAPVRQTATVVGDRAYVTAEDLRVRCCDTSSGKILWTSDQLQGQSARDYYPVVAKSGGKTFVIVRTNLVVHMPTELTRDTTFLCKASGVDNSNWKTLDAWCKGDQVRGSAEAIEKEEAAVVRELDARPESKTFFVLDAETGKEAMTAPVFWVGGCQGVGTPPVVMPHGRLQVFYRTAFTNWSHGVAPLVSLGAFDLAKNRIEPWFHENGKQPPWNTFWGTADEAQNFVLVGDTLLIVHQSTLSSFDLKTRKLTALAGERDGWGGFRNLPWARNEWNGPARGGVAVCGKRIYWLTGSRIHCYLFGAQGKPADDVEIDGTNVMTERAPDTPLPDVKEMLASAVEEVLSKRWAPLYTQQGIGGREFFFDGSADLFEALSWAYPHLPKELQQKVRAFLAAEWEARPPIKTEPLALNEGARRELFVVPEGLLQRSGHQKSPHPFANAAAIELYANRCGEAERAAGAEKTLQANYEDFKRLKAKEAQFSNRYGSALLAYATLVPGDDRVAREAREWVEDRVKKWIETAKGSTPRVYKDISDWDAFLTKGEGGLFLKIIPHNHKVALFSDLSPRAAGAIRTSAPEAAAKLWKDFETICATWHLSGEEHQVHYGENFVDPPDFSLAAFRAYAWIAKASREDLIRRVDLPFCKADLSWIIKLAIACDAK